MKILVIEDDHSVRGMLSSIMGNYGTCTAVSGGREALNSFSTALEKSEPFDLITLDIEMPDMDGKEVLRKIREMEGKRNILPESRVKIVMLTAHAEKEHLMASLKAGCDAYSLKPFNRNILEEKLRNLRLL